MIMSFAMKENVSACAKYKMSKHLDINLIEFKIYIKDYLGNSDFLRKYKKIIK